MLYQDKLNDSPKQNYTLVGENKEQIYFYLYYMPSQQCWFFDLQYSSFLVQGLKMVVGPNIMRQFREIIPFGIAVTSTDGLDPFYITDFESGRIKLYILSSDEVTAIEESFFS